MKAAELVKISSEAMKMMSEADIRLDDWRYVKLYEEYLGMRVRREKFRYIIAHLSEEYNVSESSVKRVIRRFSHEVKV